MPQSEVGRLLRVRIYPGQNAAWLTSLLAKFHFKERISRNLLDFIFFIIQSSHIDPFSHVVGRSYHVYFISAKVASRLRMLQLYDISTTYEDFFSLLLALSVHFDLPTTLLLVEIHPEPVEGELRNGSALRTRVSVGVGYVDQLVGNPHFVFELQVELVLVVEHHYVVVVHNVVAFLPVLVSGLDEECNPRRPRVRHKFDLKRVFIFVRLL